MVRCLPRMYTYHVQAVWQGKGTLAKERVLRLSGSSAVQPSQITTAEAVSSMHEEIAATPGISAHHTVLSTRIVPFLRYMYKLNDARQCL